MHLCLGARKVNIVNKITSHRGDRQPSPKGWIYHKSRPERNVGKFYWSVPRPTCLHSSKGLVYNWDLQCTSNYAASNGIPVHVRRQAFLYVDDLLSIQIIIQTTDGHLLLLIGVVFYIRCAVWTLNIWKCKFICIEFHTWRASSVIEWSAQNLPGYVTSWLSSVRKPSNNSGGSLKCAVGINNPVHYVWLTAPSAYMPEVISPRYLAWPLMIWKSVSLWLRSCVVPIFLLNH